jgi:uncharacterized Zn finger protein
LIVKHAGRGKQNMIQLVSADQLQAAIERARSERMLVQPTRFRRQYRVTNRREGTQYTVDFFVRAGKRFGHCTCPAGLNHVPCKHLAAAAAVNVAVAAMRRQAAPR